MILNKNFIVSVDFIIDAFKPNTSIYDTSYTIAENIVKRKENYYCVSIKDLTGKIYERYFDEDNEKGANEFYNDAISNLNYIGLDIKKAR
jgi:hypothetical protein